MTAFTITTPVNLSSLTPKAGNDTYTLSVVAAVLTIDTDTRYGPGTTATTGAFGTLTATQGKIVIDGTTVRLIPFTGGSGTVPAAGTAISQGANTGVLIGVWSAVNVAPTAAGAAMPATGFIKVTRVVGAYASGALTGITANASRADIPGWLELVGVEVSNVVVSRVSSLTSSGQYMYAFDTDGNEVLTSGARNQVIQWPASVVNTMYNGVWIETAPSSGIYLPWANACDIVDSATATDDRARQVWFGTQGQMRIGHDGTNAVGVLPPAGCRIRVPNIILSNTNATVGFGVNSVPNSSSGTRVRFFTNTSGVVSLTHLNSAWGNGFSSPYSINISDCTFCKFLSVTTSALAPTITRVIVSETKSADALADLATARVAISSTAGYSVTDCFFSKGYARTGFANIASFTAVSGSPGDVQRVRVAHLTNATVVNCGTFSIVGPNTLTDCDSIVGYVSLSSSTLTSLIRMKWSMTANGSVPAAPLYNLFALTSGIGLVVDNLQWLLPTTNLCHPNGNFLAFPGESISVRCKNIGTRAAPLDLGTVNPTLRVVASSSGLDSNVKFQNVWTTVPGANASSYGLTSAQFNVSIEHSNSPATAALTVNGQTQVVRALRTPQLVTLTATTGNHWADVFLTDTTGAIQILLTDPASNTTDQVTILSGTPLFSGAGALQLFAVGQSIQWTSAYFIQGHTALTSLTFAGGVAANYLIEFSADVGSGWSAWMTASNANLASVAITPSIGVRLRVRITNTTANTAPITGLTINTTSTLAAQDAVSYPAETATLSVSGIVAGSRLKVTRTDTNAVLDNASISGTTYSLANVPVGLPLQVEVRCATPPGPYYQPWIGSGTVLLTGLALQALQVRDDQ